MKCSNLIPALLCLFCGLAKSQVWTATSPMQVPRAQHVLALLSNGKVLATGSVICTLTSCVSDDTTEVFDPATGMWSAGPKMSTTRTNHVAVPLANGRVLVAGGFRTRVGLVFESELYDPQTNTFTQTGSLKTARQFHLAVRLPGGKVLVAGGLVNGPGLPATETAELYDPATGQWSPTGSMNQPRFFNTLTLLANGTVLSAGGFTDSALDALPVALCELYDPATGVWTPTGNLATARQEHSATLLPDGRVLVAGGFTDASASIDSEIYDPATGQWTAGPVMNVARGTQPAVLLPDGRVLVAGGNNDTDILASSELFDPSSPDQWIAGPVLTAPRTFHSLALLANGRVLASGGVNDSDYIINLTSSEILRTPDPEPQSVVTVSSASFADNSTVAPGLLAAAFGSGLSKLTLMADTGTDLPLSIEGVSARVQDSSSTERVAPMLSVAPGKVVFGIPADTQNGPAKITIYNGTEVVAKGVVRVTSIAPGLFSADARGSGPVLGNVIRLNASGASSTEAVAASQASGFVTVPIDLGPMDDQVTLVLYGTGIRGRSALSAVSASVGAIQCTVMFAGPSTDRPEMDQVNVRLSRDLAGSGEVDVELAVDGRKANTVRVNIR